MSLQSLWRNRKEYDYGLLAHRILWSLFMIPISPFVIAYNVIPSIVWILRFAFKGETEVYFNDPWEGMGSFACPRWPSKKKE